MMDQEKQLKLQAYLDGELPPEEALRVGESLASDSEGQALLAELKTADRALAGFASGLELPESREFYWSKIEREIQRLEAVSPVPAAPSFLAAFRRLLVPASALAVVVLAGLLMIPRHSPSGITESVVTDPGAFTYHDFANRTTLVWLSYPAESELADNDSSDVLD